MKHDFSTGKKTSVEELLKRLAEAEETIDAIKYNKIDALLITTAEGEQVYALKDAEQFYRVLIEKMNEGAVTLSPEGSIVYVNTKFSQLINVPENLIIGSSIYKWVALEDLAKFTDFIKNNIEDTKVEVCLLRGDGVQIPVLICVTALRYEGADPVICIIATDLTQQKLNEEVFAAEKLARSVIEQTSEAILVCDKDLKIIRASRGAEKLAGVKLLNIPFQEVFNLENKQSDKIYLDNIIKGPLPFQEDVLFIRQDNTYYNLIFNLNSLIGSSDIIIGYVITMANITEHVKAEEKISASLKEKTVLLKEIHHRIKNNLQIISSLLNIQASYIKDPSLQNVFYECQQRISSMALIHQKLYESKSFSHINIADYLEDMTAFLCSTYLFNSNKVTFNFSVKNVPFSIESAVPVGLIMNELITNCFKHAFVNKADGELVISLDKPDDKSICICVKDNGMGFPEGFDIGKSDTLGLQLVNTLADQLDGKVTLISEGAGAEFRILVPVS